MLKVTNETGYCFVNIHQSIHPKVILTTETFFSCRHPWDRRVGSGADF